MVPEPLSVGEAAASEHAAEWRAAMDEEISNLEKFRCFNKVPRSQALNHGRLVKSKWVFKVKYNSDNTIQRFRARLVAKGFTQVPGSDFYETYSPVFSHTSFRSTLALATVVVHLSDHNPVMVAQVDYHIRAEQSINGKETTEYIHKVSMI